MPRILILMAATVLAACQSRPLDVATPEPAADSTVVESSLHDATLAAVEAITREGLALRFFDPEAGIVETEYTDLVARLTLYRDLPENERQIRFRFVVKERGGGKSSVRLQVLQQPYHPRSFGRYYERSVGSNHPGIELARRLLAHVRELTAPSETTS